MGKLQPGDVIHGFLLKSVSDLNEYRGKGYTFEHVETKMELFHLHNYDEENLFSFAFKTPPPDDTGVAHILEHSVLSGSRNYPVKDPFMSLVKGSMNTFLNAMTYPDKTVYPASSPVEKDYFNIMGVYGDAVFFPLLKKEVFHQEGHRYEFDEEGNLRIVGVVYNEMKGAYSSHDSIAAEWSVRSLFPDTSYANNSGGEPASIPDLTYGDFVKFHDTYYHPSNCRVFLYGNINTEKQLEFLQENFLKGFKYKDIKPEIKLQKRWSGKEYFEITSALSRDETPDGKSTILINWLTKDVSDPFELLCLGAMAEILIGNAASPLYKAIVESGLGSDVSPVSGLETDLREIVFSVGLRGTDPDKRDAFEDLVEKELRRLITEGINRDTVKGVLNRMEFRNREIRGGSPAGLRLMDKAYRGWLHGYKPEDYLLFSPYMGRLRRSFEKDERFFETYINKTLLENLHRSVVVVRPDHEHSRRLEEEENKRVEGTLRSLGAKGRAQILEDNRQLKLFQQTPDSKEAEARIPTLTREDLPLDISMIDTKFEEVEGIPVYRHELFTNGIIYIDFGFDIGGLSDKENMYLPLLGKMLTSSSLPGVPYDEVIRLFSLYTGGFYSFLESSSVAVDGALKNTMFFRLKFLPEDLETSLDLVLKMFKDSLVAEKSRLKDVINEMRGDFAASIVPSGHSYAVLRAESKLNGVFLNEERWRGIEQFLFISGLAEDLTDQRLEEIGKTLENLREKILAKNRVTLNITASEDEIVNTRKSILSGLKTFRSADTKGESGNSFVPKLGEVESVYIPASVGFVAAVMKGSRLGTSNHAGELLLSHILRTEYLWETIRMKGGAYGAYASANGMEGVFSFASFRDPKIRETLLAYRQGLESLAGGLINRKTLDQAVIAVVGKDVRPLSPGEKSIIGFRRALYGISDLLRRKKRRQLLDAEPENIRNAASGLIEVFDDSSIVILASRDSIAGAAEKMESLPGKITALPG